MTEVSGVRKKVYKTEDGTNKFSKDEYLNGSFFVYTFNDPQQALAEFKANFYNLLLLDIRMPKMNGFDLYRELKKIDGNPKVCFVTAYETYYEALKKHFLTLAVSCFIKKPIEIDDLIRRITEELES